MSWWISAIKEVNDWVLEFNINKKFLENISSYRSIQLQRSINVNIAAKLLEKMEIFRNISKVCMKDKNQPRNTSVTPVTNPSGMRAQGTYQFHGIFIQIFNFIFKFQVSTFSKCSWGYKRSWLWILRQKFHFLWSFEKSCENNSFW